MWNDQGILTCTPTFVSLEEAAKKIRPRLIGIDNLADVFMGNEIVRT